MITYLLKSGLCLALILLVYKILLERERMYVFNRYYLLFGLCFAFIVPYITMEISVEIPTPQDGSLLNFENITPSDEPHIIETVPNGIPMWMYVSAGLYGLGLLILSLRFANNIYRIFYKITKNVKVFYKKASLILLKENVLPHTFLHYIFIEKEAYESENIANELYTHELAHVTQKHTLDIILIELIQIVFWFNPLLIYYKKAIQLNHEFLADDAVLKSNIQIPAYQQLLLDNANWNHNLYLASNLNFSVTKKRLQMMTKHTSRSRTWLVATLTIPIFIGALFLFSTKVIAKENTAEIIETSVLETQLVIQRDQDPKAVYYKNVKFIFEDAEDNKITKTYAELSNKDREMLPPIPKKPIAKLPTSKLLNDWENKKEFAIWIDGKVVDNTEISGYNIVHYSESYVHKNARSKNFPQPYQMHLYTTDGYKTLYKELGNPLSKDAVLHFRSGKHKGQLGKKKVGTTSEEKVAKTIQQELAEINKLPINYVNENNGPSEMELPSSQDNTIINKRKKDILLLINKNGQFLVNDDYVCKLNSLDKFIKAELAKIKHKKARAASIIYDKVVSKDLVNDAIAILKSNKIYNITTRSSDSNDEIRLPPPPTLKKPKEPKAPKVPKKTKKSKVPKTPKEPKAEKTPKEPTPKIVEVVKVPKEPKPKAIEVVKTPKKSSDWKDVKYFIEKEKNTGTYTINGETFYFTIKNGEKVLYNRFGQRVDGKGNVLKPTHKKANKTMASATNKLPTPNASNIVSHIKVMNRHKAIFYYNKKEVSFKEALRLVRANKNLHVYSEFETKDTSAFVKISNS